MLQQSQSCMSLAGLLTSRVIVLYGNIWGNFLAQGEQDDMTEIALLNGSYGTQCEV